MSTRNHECPLCNKEWHCIGCWTREEIRPCDSCLPKAYETLEAQVKDLRHEMHLMISKSKDLAEWKQMAEMFAEALAKLECYTKYVDLIELAEKTLQAYEDFKAKGDE